MPVTPFRFESFLNIAEDDQANVLAELANQDRLYLAFYGEDLKYRYMKIVPHDKQQWQQIDEMRTEALVHISKINIENRNFDRAKADFISRYI